MQEHGRTRRPDVRRPGRGSSRCRLRPWPRRGAGSWSSPRRRVPTPEPRPTFGGPDGRAGRTATPPRRSSTGKTAAIDGVEHEVATRRRRRPKEDLAVAGRAGSAAARRRREQGNLVAEILDFEPGGSSLRSSLNARAGSDGDGQGGLQLGDLGAPTRRDQVGVGGRGRHELGCSPLGVLASRWTKAQPTAARSS